MEIKTNEDLPWKEKDRGSHAYRKVEEDALRDVVADGRRGGLIDAEGGVGVAVARGQRLLCFTVLR